MTESFTPLCGVQSQVLPGPGNGVSLVRADVTQYMGLPEALDGRCGTINPIIAVVPLCGIINMLCRYLVRLTVIPKLGMKIGITYWERYKLNHVKFVPFDHQPSLRSYQWPWTRESRYINSHPITDTQKDVAGPIPVMRPLIQCSEPNLHFRDRYCLEGNAFHLRDPTTWQ